ncbi:phosphopantothenoylcysteine decarboxylase [Vagococcus xieshaowenii]|uniref:Phosphopantothenoylcysteine decarboxylase n=1 Tax=Vagococcus xieshaowenii TaxID=2562451 RepID=A0AAJ5EFV9_9ENTE|nr:phosphopantothenoylcysteine decarboxylase [Vagococcus xieshaowenii]QCA28542.1 phosphopantothenoylcysteine decarboxylase [Vagococcus xieshaowenii]TFZ40650.1 phosphopantothenoylcysteine decarboxylase [Vagococcus xieshaowenii]
MANILMGVSGSISAYKAADIVSSLSKQHHHINVMMTKSSTEFITPLTLQSLSKNYVYTNVMEEQHPEVISHIELAKQADVFIIAPATANIIGKLANGIADDIVTATALALPNNATPKFIAPAMNTNMYLHPAVQKNLQTLVSYGYQIIEPKESLLACGDYGKGALADVQDIVEAINQIIA